MSRDRCGSEIETLRVTLNSRRPSMLSTPEFGDSHPVEQCRTTLHVRRREERPETPLTSFRRHPFRRARPVLSGEKNVSLDLANRGSLLGPETNQRGLGPLDDTTSAPRRTGAPTRTTTLGRDGLPPNRVSICRTRDVSRSPSLGPTRRGTRRFSGWVPKSFTPESEGWNFSTTLIFLPKQFTRTGPGRGSPPVPGTPRGSVGTHVDVFAVCARTPEAPTVGSLPEVSTVYHSPSAFMGDAAPHSTGPCPKGPYPSGVPCPPPSVGTRPLVSGVSPGSFDDRHFHILRGMGPLGGWGATPPYLWGRR